MTVSVPNNLVRSYAGDGLTVNFSYPIRFDADDELVVVLRSAGGVDTTQTLGSDYTVAGEGTASGSVTFLTAPASGVTVLIYRATEETQVVDLEDAARNPAEAVELQLDRTVRMIQDHKALLSRSVVMRPGSQGVVFPEPSDGKFIGWNGSELANFAAADVGSETLPLVANTILKRNAANTAFEAKPVGTTGLAVLGAETQQAGRDALGIIPTFSVRDVTAATAAAAQADGTIVRIAGYPYKVDSTATGEDSLTYDLGVDGLVPFDRVTPRMCGAVGDGGTGAGTNDRAAIQRAWVIAAAHKVPCFMEGLKYNSDEAIYTDSNLYVVAQGSEIFFTGWPAVGGFITNVWGSADTANAPERRVQSNVNLYDLAASGELLPPPGPTENANLFGFARGMYGARVVNCVARKMRLGFGAGSGGGGFGDEQGTHDVVYINCRAEDCFRGVRVAGMSGTQADSAAEPKSLTNQRFINFTAVRCGTAILAHSISAPAGDWDASNLFRFDATFEGVTHIEDCGHYPWLPFDFDANPTYSPQKSGVITMAGAMAVYIADLRVKIISTYTSTADWLGQSGYPSGGSNYIGAGLSGNVGALVRGWGRDVVIGRVTLQGSLDCYLNIDRCVTVGDVGTAPPTSLCDKVSFVIGSIDHISGSVQRLIDAAVGLDNAKIGVELNDVNLLAVPTVEYVSTAAALDNIMIELVNSAGKRMRGRASEFVPAPSTLFPVDHMYMGSFGAGAGYSPTGTRSGITYETGVLRQSVDSTSFETTYAVYDTGGLIAQDGAVGGRRRIGLSGTSVFLQVGSGSPEGVLSASVGSIYVNVAGGGQPPLYVKESGAGSTGWAAVTTA